MKGLRKGFAHVVQSGVLAFSAFWFASCASIPELKVHYQLPKGSEHFQGKSIALLFEDARPSKDFIGKGAKEDFALFSGKFSYSFARYNESGFKRGLFALPDLFREVFKQRLENEGSKVVLGAAPGVPELRIVLTDLLLDLSNRNWTATMKYDAKLFLEGKEVASQSLSGGVERAKVVGTSGADAVMGELFTDMANRLDLARLFARAS